MSEKADYKLSQRQHFARRGGALDKILGLANIIFPGLALVILLLLTFYPFSQRSELSFVLDHKVAEIAKERLRVEGARYRGEDSSGRPFTLQAGSAMQKTSMRPEVDLTDLSARLLLKEGPAEISANSGTYYLGPQIVSVDGPVHVSSVNGYQLATADVDIDLKEKTLQSKRAVVGRSNIGNFRADRLEADLNERTVLLEGNARLRITQKTLRK